MACGFTTGVPKPQYVPRLSPWLTGGVGFYNYTVSTVTPYNMSSNVFASSTVAGCTITKERNVCFGTYLPYSTPQVRSTHNNETSTTMMKIPSDTTPTYNITNLRYVGMQTILPDEVTASIVRQAASSDISLHAQSVRTYRTILAQSNNQSLIFPIKVASANSLWVIFQNQNVLKNTHYLSTTRTCLFLSYQFQLGTSQYAVGSDTKPAFTPVNAVTPISIQLRIGNELVPQQPMTSVQHVITELIFNLLDLTVIVVKRIIQVLIWPLAQLK